MVVLLRVRILHCSHDQARKPAGRPHPGADRQGPGRLALEQQGIGSSNALSGQSAGQASASQALLWGPIGCLRVGFRPCRVAPARCLRPFRTHSRLRAERIPALSSPHRVVFGVRRRASCPAVPPQPPWALRAGRAGSAQPPVRRAFRSARGMDDPLRVKQVQTAGPVATAASRACSRSQRLPYRSSNTTTVA